jgi:putative endonuclease
MTTVDEGGQHFAYIAECADGTYYTGYAKDIESRAKAHNEGKGSKYTRGRLPVKIVYSEEFASKSEAMKREAAIKRMSRKAKKAMLHGTMIQNEKC